MNRIIFQNKQQNKNRGFIALFSVIIISFVLLSVATTLNFSGFYGRFNVLDTEMKKISGNLADACIEKARLVIAQNTSYTGTASVTVGSKTCDYVVSNQSGDKIIVAHSEVNKAHTYYKVVVNNDVSTIPITSFEELPTPP
ncbi:MAG: hypothetical protein M3Q34_00760 [bacterium]|nr:hypothetical protein [bacterium]